MAPSDRDPSEGINAAIAAELRAERAAKRLTIDELSDKSGIPRRTLLRLLAAERHINVDQLAGLAVGLGVSQSDLFARGAARLKREQEIDQWARFLLDQGRGDLGQAIHELQRQIAKGRMSNDLSTDVMNRLHLLTQTFDPAAGTGGFVTAAADYVMADGTLVELKATHSELLADDAATDAFNEGFAEALADVAARDEDRESERR